MKGLQLPSASPAPGTIGLAAPHAFVVKRDSHPSGIPQAFSFLFPSLLQTSHGMRRAVN